MGDTGVPTKASGGESPTTARPIDFDDDQQETGTILADGTSNADPPPSKNSGNRVRFDEEAAPPPKPPRPMSPQQQAETTLIEAFPSIDAKVVKAVLVASGGQVEPAFNALLSMSDPSFAEEAPPPRPPRRTAEQRQMEQDELYARQLAQQYQAAYQPYSAPPQGQPRGARRQPRPPPPTDNREPSFFDDELPEIGENIRQGFLKTQSRIRNWISSAIDKDGTDGDDARAESSSAVGRRNFGTSQAEQMPGVRSSTDRERYDADPQVLSGDFKELELYDDEAPPKKPPRPTANPNLFKPTPLPPQSGPVDEVDAASTTFAMPGAAAKSKKWQPLTSIAPNPEADDHDPFSLGDSDEEKDAKTQDVSPHDTKRLKNAASASESNGAAREGLEAHEQSGSMGTRDKEAEELLKSS